jgi:hypothetical protein
MATLNSSASDRNDIIRRIFERQGEHGFWTVIPESNKYYPDYVHYVPIYNATLWTLILLADLEADPSDPRVQAPLNELQHHFFDDTFGLFSLKDDHFPIPCLNGNMIYLDCYFNGRPGAKCRRAIEFFATYQRFDDGCYEGEPNRFYSNKRCYGKHSCYWGIVKLMKGLSFIPYEFRTPETHDLLDRCIRFVRLHRVCYRSHQADRIMIPKMDLLTFPNMYKSDFLEILWILKRENVMSDDLIPALDLLRSKCQADGNWHLERLVHNMAAPIGRLNQPNPFITNRAKDVLGFYGDGSRFR